MRMNRRMGGIVVSASCMLMAGVLHAKTILHDEFDSGVEHAEVYSGGRSKNFWMSRTDTEKGSRITEKDGKLCVTIVNESSYSTMNLCTSPGAGIGGFSGEWDFFSKTVTLKVRGIHFSDAGTARLPAGNMHAAWGFLANGFLFGTPDNTHAIRMQVSGDGKVRLEMRKESVNSVVFNNLNQAVDGMTGFDLTLGPGSADTAYVLRIYNAGADVISSGTISIRSSEWPSRTPLTSRFAITVNESASGTDVNQKFEFSTESVTIDSDLITVGRVPYSAMISG